MTIKVQSSSVYTFRLLSILAITGFLSLSLAKGEVVDRIIAKVNSDVITLSELEDISRQSEIDLNDSTRELVLNKLIDRILLVQAARKSKIEIPDSYINLQVEKEMQRIKSNFKKTEDYTAWLAKQQLTEDAIRIMMRDRISNELLINRFLRKSAPPVTDDDIRKYTHNNPEEAAKQETVHLKQIFFEVPEDATADEKEAIHQKALQCQRELKMGASFDALVEQFSDDSAGKEEKGDLGFIHHGEVMPEIEKLAFSLKEGEYSDPILTERGYHIILVLEKASIREYLYEQSIDNYQKDMLKKLRAEAVILIK
jgi:parvulin-like peptidyl-prolyl isomerase